MSTFRSMLESLGQSIVEEKSTELEMGCPFHEDRHPSFYVNKETGAWICHSGCGSGGFFELYERLKVMDVEAPKPSGDAPIALDMGLEVLTRRGFTPQMLERWEIAYNEDVGNIEIPCYDIDSHFLGYIARMPEGVHPKYRHPEGFHKKLVLFGMHKIVPLGDRKEVILVEGPLDAIWLQEAGYPAVAILGSRLSVEQASILHDLGVRNAVFCFDNDVPGRVAAVVANELLQALTIWVWHMAIPSAYKDIQEVPLAEISALVEARHVFSARGLIPPALRRWVSREVGGTDAASIWRY